MSTSDPVSDPGAPTADDELQAIAESALRALRCDVVLITVDGSAVPGPSVVCARDGTVTSPAPADVVAALTEPVGAVPPGTGYRRHCAVELRLGGRHLGTLHALSRGGPVLDRALVEAFASHCAFTIGYGQLNHRVRRASMFDQLALTTTTFTELLPRLEEAVASVVGPVIVGVSAWDEESGLLELVPGSFRASLEMTESHAVDPKDLHSNASRVFELQRPFVTNAARGDPAIIQSYILAFDLESLMAIPLTVAARPTGVLMIGNKPGGFTADDLRRCEEVAPRVAVAVELTRMHLRLRMRGRVDRALSEVGLSMMRSRELAETLPEVLESVRALTDADVLAVVPEAGPPIVTTATGVAPDVHDELVADAHRAMGEHRAATAAAATGAVFHVPIGLELRWSRMLSASRVRGSRFTHDQCNALTRSADLVALSFAADNVREQRIALARLKDRQRIADDLHDDVGQLLFAAQIAIDTLLEREPTEADGALLRRVGALLVKASTAIRDVIFELSPPPEGTVVERLRGVAGEVEQQWPVTVTLDVEPAAAHATATAGGDIAAILVRAARECLVNAAKHAGPCAARLTLTERDGSRLHLCVVDDGPGATVATSARHGHGLRSLRRTVHDLGGTLRVDRPPSGGTRVTVDLPL